MHLDHLPCNTLTFVIEIIINLLSWNTELSCSRYCYSFMNNLQFIIFSDLSSAPANSTLVGLLVFNFYSEELDNTKLILKLSSHLSQLLKFLHTKHKIFSRFTIFRAFQRKRLLINQIF